MEPNDPKRAALERLLPLPPGTNLDILLAYNPAFFKLLELLHPGETVRAYCVSKLEQASHERHKGDWILVCTEGRLLFLSKGLGFTHFELDRRQITSIEEDPGWIFFSVTITASGPPIKLFQYSKPDMVRLLSALRAS